MPFPNAYRGPDARAGSRRARTRRCRCESRLRRLRRSCSSPCRARPASRAAREEFVRGLRRICDEHGIVLVAEEVVVRRVCSDRPPVRDGAVRRRACPAHRLPSSIAGGLPLSGVLGRAELMNAPPDSAIGGTFPGSLVARAAGARALDLIEEEGLVDRAETLGADFRSGMERWRVAPRRLGDVRGPGALPALELVADRVDQSVGTGLLADRGRRRCGRARPAAARRPARWKPHSVSSCRS